MVGSAIILAGLSLALQAVAISTPLQVYGNHTSAHIDALLEAFDGNLTLPHDLGFGGAFISGLVFNHPGNVSSLFGSSSSTHGGHVVARALYTTSDVVCTDPPTYGDRLLTVQQQAFINGKFCTFLGTVEPNTSFFVGLTIGNLKCGVNFKFVCQGVVGVSTLVNGKYIGPGIQTNCQAALADLVTACGEDGGSEQVTITSTGSEFLVESFASTDIANVCTSSSTEQCSTYTCDGDCNPGGSVP